MVPRRYQLRKEAVAIVTRGHPWLFRDQMSSAASVLSDGQWLRLVGGDNRIVGYGIYEAEGAIAIRMLKLGADPPDAAWLSGRLAAAIDRRAELAKTTDGLRLVHGESDGIPAVVADRFGDVVVVASYCAGADPLARYVAHRLELPHVILRPARRRRGPVASTQRIIRGTPPEVARFTEDDTMYAVDIAAGHKTGTYLDLRGLRRAIGVAEISSGASLRGASISSGASLRGARVLNLFAYTGMIGRAAERAGAAEIVQVDASERALEFAAAHHVSDAARHRFVTADVFDWQPTGEFDLTIVDPPAMTSRRAQVPSVLAAYRRLYRRVAPHVRPGGVLVAACCTSRVTRAEFTRTVRGALGERFVLERELPAEPDHPVGFAEADYLKIGWWRARLS
jgi:23S rRNA (cytosine1962-C5)-methyltransferase